MLYPKSRLYLPNPRKLYSFIRPSFQKKVLSLHTIQAILSLYGLSLDGIPKQVTSGMRNTTIVVNTTRGKKVLKRYKESLSDSTIIQEHSILRYLGEKNFPCVRIVSANSGQTITYYEKDRYALFDFVKGFKLYDYIFLPGTKEQFIAASGNLLGKLHRLLNDFVPKGFNPDGFNPETNRRWRDTEWFLSKIDDIKKHASDGKNIKNTKLSIFLAEYRSLGKLLVEVQKQLQQANLPRQIIHKDFGQSNIIFRKNKSPIVIDFEIARLDWRVIDLINAWEKFCRNRFRYSEKKMKIFLDAYQKEVNLSQNEFKNIQLVWKYLNITRCIFHFHKFSITGSKLSLAHANRYLKQTRWKADHYNKVKTVTDSKESFIMSYYM